MTAQSGNFASARSRYMTQQQRRDDEAREERRIKALWFLYRNGHMDIAEILGLSPTAALSPTWRETLSDSVSRERKRNEDG